LKDISLEGWEKKYIVSLVERFDRKNTMFNRIKWDPEIINLLEDWSIITNSPKDKPGHTLDSVALRLGSIAGTQLKLPNVQQPDLKSGNKNITGEERIDTSSKEESTRIIKKAARWFGADLVGICKIDNRWFYTPTPGENNTSPQEILQEYQYAVVLAFEMDYDLISYFNTQISESAVSIGYSRMAVTNTHLATFIRDLGFKAIPCGNDTALSIPMAMQAGLGDLGRNGLLITPEFGPRVRISKIITDLPLLVDNPIDFGVTEFCTVCKKCAYKCPSRSIITGDRTAEANNKSNVAGELKWPVNAETCRTYWSQRKIPCSSCIATCPYNKPYTRFHRTARWLTDHIRGADPFYSKMDDLLGYGKPKNPKSFWEKWQPTNGYGGNFKNTQR
jgi:reductive dehalogenase